MTLMVICPIGKYTMTIPLEKFIVGGYRYQDRGEEGEQIPKALFSGNSYMHSLPTVIPEGLANEVPPG